MSREELIENLGTIARSGTAQFLDEMENRKDGAGLIGKFGVGFYSAFMVADKVTVETRKAGEDKGWRWVSEGQGEFAIAESDAAPARGTRITLHVKKDQKEYLDPVRLRQVIKTYSDRSDPPGRRGRLDQRGLGAVEPAALGHQRRAIQRVLSPRRAQLRRPLAAAPLQSRGGDRIYRPAVRALKQAFRPLSPGPQRADQALCAAGLHYR
jgi:hypothetical protein